MSGRTMTMQHPLSRRGDLVLPAPFGSAHKRHNSPSTASPETRFFPRRQACNDAKTRTVWFTHSSIVLDRLGAREDRSIRRRVTMASSVSIQLQQGVSVKRHPSSYFPCLPSVTRFGAYPAPCGTARLCFGLSAALRVSAFRKSLCKDRKRFSEPSEKAPLGTWERGTSRRFAQECPEGNPGKYKQGETQWHSTKTKSH